MSRQTALWNGQAHMPTTERTRLTIVEGDGAYVTTADGARLLDATAGLWHANVGHGRESIARAAYEQMCRLETYHCFGRFTNEPAMHLADRLAAIGPVPDAKVMLTSGGSDSVDLAAKLARRHWQLEGQPERTVIVSRERAYHGLHGFGTSLTGLEYNREGYGTASLVPDTVRVPTHDLDAARAVLADVGPERIAAIITEPVIGTGGVHGPTPGYLEGLQHLAAETGALFIVDEVITGFGRTGRMFGSERWGLAPDMVAIAKGLTSGYPHHPVEVRATGAGAAGDPVSSDGRSAVNGEVGLGDCAGGGVPGLQRRGPRPVGHLRAGGRRSPRGRRR